MSDSGVDDRASYVYYIHRWRDPPAPSDVVVTIPEMEAYIMRVFGTEAPDMRDPVAPSFRAFYHDHWRGGQLCYADHAATFSDASREGVRRVLGCGHFILCMLCMTLNCLAVEEGDDWPYARFWPRMRDNLNATGLLKPEAPCNAAGVYRWLQGFFFRHVFDRIPDSDPYKEHVRTPQTKLRVLSSPCNPTADATTDKFQRNYH